MVGAGLKIRSAPAFVGLAPNQFCIPLACVNSALCSARVTFSPTMELEDQLCASCIPIKPCNAICSSRNARCRRLLLSSSSCPGPPSSTWSPICRCSSCTARARSRWVHQVLGYLVPGVSLTLLPFLTAPAPVLPVLSCVVPDTRRSSVRACHPFRCPCLLPCTKCHALRHLTPPHSQHPMIP